MEPGAHPVLGSGDNSEFAQRLCGAVNPETVIFSIGRGRYQTPRNEIVKGVKVAAPNYHIVCTQLSGHCADRLPSSTPSHLSGVPSRGRSSNM